MQIILSTRNASKAEQIKAIFAAMPLTILTLDEAGIEGEGIEDGTTLQENALKKAVYAHEHSNPKSWTMADDTGLFITSLDGAPGIKAARWAGEHATSEEILDYTLQKLAEVTDRSARFETVVALIAPDGEQHFFNGSVDGTLLEQSRVQFQKHMPYSGIFKPNESDMVWAEMDVDYENTISHRGKAFGKAKEFLQGKI